MNNRKLFIMFTYLIRADSDVKLMALNGLHSLNSLLSKHL